MASPGLQQTQRLGLQQVLSPQMQQSLHILQSPTLELSAMIREELTTNPDLEEAPVEDSAAEPSLQEMEEDAREGEVREEVPDDELKKLLQLDQEWRDYFNQSNPPRRRSAEEESQRQTFFDSIARPETLQEHLLTQLHESEAAPAVAALCENLIGNLDRGGFLVATAEDLAAWSGGGKDLLEEALALLQSFDPIGVGARDLREGLLIQLRRLGHDGHSIAARLVAQHLDDLAARRHAEIATVLDLSLDEVHRAAALISTLDPQPGRHFAEDANRYITADLAVQKISGEWVVIMNDESLPHLRVSDTYKDILGQSSPDAEAKSYVRERLRSARFFIRSIHQRQQTILRIAHEIVARQGDFLELGREQLKPMTMNEVARHIGVHETTVSRAVSGKYMQTPHGIFELKYFFTTGIHTADGKVISPDRVKNLLAEIVANEPPSRPLADQDIMSALQAQGFPVARRTVAKYREELGILPSHQRRSRT